MRRKLPRIVIASAVMAGAVGAVAAAGETLLAGPEPVRIAAVAALVIGGVVLYAALAQISGAVSLAELKRSLAPATADQSAATAGGDAPVP